MTPKARTSPAILRIRVSLVDSDPEIWREIDVAPTVTLSELHDVLQIAFGWSMSHDHSFTDGDPFAPRHDLPRIGPGPRRWAPNDSFSDPDPSALTEREWTLGHVFDGFDGPLYYEYDFGDGWTHQIDLVERIDSDADAPQALVVAGERRGPLEDSGGIGG